MKSKENEIQKLTDKYCKEAEEVTAAKESEVLKI
jgi:ribosome recycling factor